MFLTVYMYITIMAFVVFSLRKARQYARNPLAGRWELYPVMGSPAREGAMVVLIMRMRGGGPNLDRSPVLGSTVRCSKRCCL
ncbi:MAG: hypothetical protein RQM92_01955 [Candidatus Syntrophopropionicum ammoniitolerans]